jgi:hypothetical protein
MFGRKLRALKKIVDEHLATAADALACETCGCLVLKKDAIRGKGEVRQGASIFDAQNVDVESGSGSTTWSTTWTFIPDAPTATLTGKDYLYHPYYCKRCARKAKKGGKA